MTTEIHFEHAGTSLFAVEAGAGTPIVLLHGGLATHRRAQLIAGSLTERFRVITPDLRASGRSIYAGAITWDLLADDIVALVRHLGLARAVIGGISFGAGVAVRVALRHPELVQALVVLHPAFAGGDIGLTPAQAAAMQAMADAGARALTEGMNAMFPLLAALPLAVQAAARQAFATYDPASVAALTRFMASGAQPFATAAELAAIAPPVLLVPGVDPQHPREVAEVYRRELPQCTTVDTTDFAAAIADFLAGH